MTELAFRAADDPATGPADTPTPARCAALARTERGWEMCHRSDHPDDQPHHVRDRSWYTLKPDRKTPLLTLGATCDESCKWPDYVQPYLGRVSGPSTVCGGLEGYSRRTRRRA